MALAWCFLCSLATCLTDLIQTLVIPLLLQTLTQASAAGKTQTTQSSSISSSSSSSSFLPPSALSFSESSTSPSAKRIQFNSIAMDQDQHQQRPHSSPLFIFLVNFFNVTSQILTRLIIYLIINLVCLYTKYLIDLAQRNAFLETRRSIETRAKIERENDKQERLLLSLLPRFVALEIIADIAREDNHDKLLKNQFHKIYIHSYSNVR